NDDLQKQRIVGGFFDEIESAPYYAQILKNGALLCGAAIISDSWIITAAHCVDSLLTMKELLSLFLIIHGTSPYFIDNEVLPRDKIVGGYYDAIEKVPYVAQILRNGVLICGGAVIAESWILTAAHCIAGEVSLTVMVGSTIRSFGDEEHEVKRTIPHPAFNSKTNENDIALIQLTTKIKSNSKQWPISISNKRPKAGQIMKVSGFGRESKTTGRSPIVKSMKVPVIENQKCQEVYKKKGYVITKNMFCAQADVSDAGDGDSGGPGIINNLLVGIVSFGTNQAKRSRFPGVYTNVFYFRDWIENETGIPDLYSLERALTSLSKHSPDPYYEKKLKNRSKTVKSEPGTPYKRGE
ncbi:hypothetical protein QAD02_003820, partial [Eretmocerus hayati]